MKHRRNTNKFEVKTKLRRGDEVIVIAGKDKGKKGKIERINKKKMSVLIPGINIVKKHKRSQDQQRKPEIVDMPAPLPLSNIMLVDPKSGEPTRIGYKVVDGKKVRFAKKSGVVIKDKGDSAIKEKKEKVEKPEKEDKKGKKED
jgi:large subunit ribosomal protein L24